MRRLAEAVSYLYHPFLIPLATMAILFWIPTLPKSFYIYDAIYLFPEGAKWNLILVFGVLTCIAPLLSVLIMYWNNMISSLKLKDRGERTLPFIIVIFYYCLAYFYFRYEWYEPLRHEAILSFLFGIIVVFVLTFLLNFYIKISLHTIGMFGMAGGVLAYHQSQIMGDDLIIAVYIIILGSLVATARLYLNAHKLSEVLIGMGLGFITMYMFVKNGIYV